MSPPQQPVRCPFCGHLAGLYLAPRDERTAYTPVRCLKCRGEAPMTRWFEPPQPVKPTAQA